MVCGMPRTYGCAVSKRSGDGLGMPAKKPPTGYCLPSARNRSSGVGDVDDLTGRARRGDDARWVAPVYAAAACAGTVSEPATTAP